MSGRGRLDPSCISLSLLKTALLPRGSACSRLPSPWPLLTATPSDTLLLSGVEYIVEEERQRNVSIGSVVTFFRNGKCQGKAFEDIWAEVYYPAASLYKAATVEFNFGPDFAFQPPADAQCRPCSDLAKAQMEAAAAGADGAGASGAAPDTSGSAAQTAATTASAEAGAPEAGAPEAGAESGAGAPAAEGEEGEEGEDGEEDEPMDEA